MGGGGGGCDESLMIGHLNVSNSLRDMNEQERNKYRERERWGSAPPPWNDDVSLVCIRGPSPW